MGKELRKTKIVCTLGPSTEDDRVLDGLIRSGMNVARFNFSHGTHEYHKRMLERLRERCDELSENVAVLLDTKGPEIRTGFIADDGEIELRRGEEIVLTTEEVAGTADRISISHYTLPDEVGPGDHIYLADGRIDLLVLEASFPDIRCEIRVGGLIGGRKNVNIPGIRSSLPAITEKDREDIAFGVAQNIDFIAASFVRTPENVIEIRELLDTLGSSAEIIAKIEDQQGVDNIDEIIRVADAIMVARGDLGVQLPTEQIPLVQKRIISKANRENRAVIVATQMLESMINDSRPTRAELTDVANAIFDGADAVMLSGETASGRYPVEAVRMMDRIARTVESSEEYLDTLKKVGNEQTADAAGSIARSACTIAESVGAVAIICPSLRGNTPRIVSRFRPRQSIIAATTSRQVQRQLLLYWGIEPVITEQATDSESMVQNAIREAMKLGVAKPLDRLISVAGVPVNSPIMVNTIRFHVLGTVLAKGKFGTGPIRSGRIEKLDDGDDTIDRGDGVIALVRGLGHERALALAEHAAAIIAEGAAAMVEPLMRSDGVAIPVVAEVPGAFEQLEEGATVTVDGTEKLVYEGVMM